MQKVLIKLQKKEVAEIEGYFERMNSIKALTLTFELDEIFSKNSNMYEKLIQDMSVTSKKLESWWARMIGKYSLEKYKPDQLYVDFFSEQIILTE